MTVEGSCSCPPANGGVVAAFCSHSRAGPESGATPQREQFPAMPTLHASVEPCCRKLGDALSALNCCCPDLSHALGALHPHISIDACWTG